MARKITEDMFDEVMEDLAETLGIRYHAEAGHFHADGTIEETAQNVTAEGAVRAMKEAYAGFEKQVNQLTEAAHKRFDERLAQVEERQQMLMAHLGLSFHTDPERTYIVGDALAAGAPSSTRSNAARKREAIKRAETARAAAEGPQTPPTVGGGE